MSVNELAHTGVFAIALVIYFFATGAFGAFASGGIADDLPGPAWIMGGFLYGITVTFMRRG